MIYPTMSGRAESFLREAFSRWLLIVFYKEKPPSYDEVGGLA